MIVVRELQKRFGDRAIFKGIDLRVETGEVVVLIGPSGSGKSTLLRCIGGLETFDHGSIRIGDREILGTDSRHWTRADRENIRRMRMRVGMVFQHFNLFPHMTVLGNVLEAPVHVLGLAREEALARAESALAKVNLTALSGRRPEALSGGEKQRAAIARALAMHPECILFDEPTSSLDPETVGDVLQVMRALADEGMTMLIVTHEMSFARQVADQVLMLDAGEIIERGAADTIFRAPSQERTRAFLKRVLHD